MQELTREQIGKIRDWIIPLVPDGPSRSALLFSAFPDQDALCNSIRLEGSADVFANGLIAKLREYGEVRAGESALAVLLNEIRSQYGSGKQQQIDELLALLSGSAAHEYNSTPVVSPIPPSLPTPAPVVNPVPESKPDAVAVADPVKKTDAPTKNLSEAVLEHMKAQYGFYGAVVAALSAIGVAYFNSHNSSSAAPETKSQQTSAGDVLYSGRVTDATTKKSLADAAVSVMQSGKAILNKRTDDNGNFSFSLEKGAVIDVRCEKTGYEIFTNNGLPIDRLPLGDIRLTPIAKPALERK